LRRLDISEKEKDPTSIPLPVGVSLPLGKGREALKPPFPGREGSRVVSYSQRKIKTRYQSLSPRGGEVWREGKIYGSKREIDLYTVRVLPPLADSLPLRYHRPKIHLIASLRVSDIMSG